jgi:hypothetical protein
MSDNNPDSFITPPSSPRNLSKPPPLKRFNRLRRKDEDDKLIYVRVDPETKEEVIEENSQPEIEVIKDDDESQNSLDGFIVFDNDDEIPYLDGDDDEEEGSQSQSPKLDPVCIDILKSIYDKEDSEYILDRGFSEFALAIAECYRDKRYQSQAKDIDYHDVFKRVFMETVYYFEFVKEDVNRVCKVINFTIDELIDYDAVSRRPYEKLQRGVCSLCKKKEQCAYKLVNKNDGNEYCYGSICFRKINKTKALYSTFLAVIQSCLRHVDLMNNNNNTRGEIDGDARGGIKFTVSTIEVLAKQLKKLDDALTTYRRTTL